MEKYLDLKMKDRFLSILIFLIRILLLAKKFFNRVDFPVNFDLNLIEREKI